MKKIGGFFWNIIETVALFFLRLLFWILRRELTEKDKNAFLQFVRYVLVGFSNTMVTYILYALILFLIKAAGIWKTYDYLIANVLSFALGVLWAFFWNNKYVFAVKEGEYRSMWRALLKSYVSYSFTGLFLNSILITFWVEILHLSKFIAPMFNLLLTVPINFVVNKFWAFKKEER